MHLIHLIHVIHVIHESIHPFIHRATVLHRANPRASSSRHRAHLAEDILVVVVVVVVVV